MQSKRVCCIARKWANGPGIPAQISFSPFNAADPAGPNDPATRFLLSKWFATLSAPSPS
jgi:hypothetical protein